MLTYAFVSTVRDCPIISENENRGLWVYICTYMNLWVYVYDCILIVWRIHIPIGVHSLRRSKWPKFRHPRCGNREVSGACSGDGAEESRRARNAGQHRDDVWRWGGREDDGPQAQGRRGWRGLRGIQQEGYWRQEIDEQVFGELISVASLPIPKKGVWTQQHAAKIMLLCLYFPWIPGVCWWVLFRCFRLLCGIYLYTYIYIYIHIRYWTLLSRYTFTRLILPSLLFYELSPSWAPISWMSHLTLKWVMAFVWNESCHTC